MGTPQWTRFSALSRTIEEVCKEDLADVVAKYEIKVKSVSELGIVPHNGAFGDVDRPFIECDSFDAALNASKQWMGVAIHCRVEAVWENIALNFWIDRSGPTARTAFALYAAREVFWIGSELDREGQWLMEFQLALMAAVKAECCGFGSDDDYYFVYQPLDPQKLLSRVRDGSLFQMHSPIIHMIATTLMSAAEIDAALAKHPPRQGLEHRESISGSQVLWNFQPG